MSLRMPFSQACGECSACTSSTPTVTDHPPFGVKYNDPRDGIDVEWVRFTAQQIADAFINLIPEHMDWPIKQDALARWKTLQPDFGDGSRECIAEFDIMPAWEIFNDFLFIGLLKDLCCIKWVDQGDIDNSIGRFAYNTGIRGPRAWIYIVRPSPLGPCTVQDCLETLLHEMCHALLYLACQCNVCGCHLNRINGEGMRYHGPSWESVRRTVENTASMHFPGFSRRFYLCGAYEPDLELERQTECRILHSLFRKIEGHGNVLEKQKGYRRAEKKAERQPNTPEESRSDQVLDEAMEYMVAIFTRGDFDVEMDEALEYMITMFAKGGPDIENQR